MKRLKVSILFIAILSAFAIVLTGCGGGGGGGGKSSTTSHCPDFDYPLWCADAGVCCTRGNPHYCDGKCYQVQPSGCARIDTCYESSALISSSQSFIDEAQLASVGITGEWYGTYSSNTTATSSINFSLSRKGDIINGTYSTANGAKGTINGTVGIDKINFTMSNTSLECQETFDGSAVVNSFEMTFKFEGSNCRGEHIIGEGIVTRK